jgi:hypothetical protein
LIIDSQTPDVHEVRVEFLQVKTILSVGFEVLTALFCLPPAFTLVSCSAYFLTLKMEAICSSEMSDDTQRTTRRYIPEDGTLHNFK